MSIKNSTIGDCLFFETKTFIDRGYLCPLEAGIDLPFKFQRIFWVWGNDGEIRGKHAKKVCTQAFVCMYGTCEIRCRDGKNERVFVLDKPNKILVVPPYIYDEEFYATTNTCLLVLCDTSYSSKEYIYSWDEFLKEKECQTDSISATE